MARSKVASTIAFHVDNSEKSQADIAEEAGFGRPNMISMLKSGVTKLPILRIVPLAKALGIDERDFFRTVMSEYMPDLLAVLDALYGADQLTKNEREIISRIRLTSRNKDPKVNSKNSHLLDAWVKEAV